MSDDSIFREVDEAIRQEQLKKLWDKYGLIVIAGAVFIIAAVGGYKAWVYWQGEQAKAAGSRFVGGLTQIQDGQQTQAQEVFKSLAEDGPSGYRTLSQFQLAALHVKEGRTDDAVKLYNELASRSGIGDALQSYAKLQIASLRIDQLSFDEMRAELDSLTATDNPWRHSARELLGLSAYKEKNVKVAERYFNIMLSDQQTPGNMRQRAEMMLALMAQIGGDGAGDAK